MTQVKHTKQSRLDATIEIDECRKGEECLITIYKQLVHKGHLTQLPVSMPNNMSKN